MGYFSNGTEGAMYEEQYCSRCIHFGDDDKGCPVWFAHLLFAYEECNSDSNAAQMLDLLIPRGEIIAADGIPMPINEQCTMFHPRDAGAAIQGQLRIEAADD